MPPSFKVYEHSLETKKLKNTKIKNPVRFWKKSKFIESDYLEDLEKVVDYFKEKGFRDARIISDTIINTDKKNLEIEIKLEEGNKYIFGDLKFIGNDLFINSLDLIKEKKEIKIKEKGSYYSFPKRKDVKEFKSLNKKFF